MNKVEIEGTLTRKPYTKSGNGNAGAWQLAKLTVLPDGQEKGMVDVTAWGECAKAAANADQGTRLSIVGTVRMAKRDDLQTVNEDRRKYPVRTLEIVADSKEGGHVEVLVSKAAQDDLGF